MNATLTIATLKAQEPLVVKGDAAREVADSYLQSISAYWRGEPGLAEVEYWLTSFGENQVRFDGGKTADAVSPHGAGGRGIRWYETPSAVFGLIPGSPRGYRIPIDAISPSRFSHSANQSSAVSQANEPLVRDVGLLTVVTPLKQLPMEV